VSEKITIRNPAVSVCVPTYNGSAFLDQTLQSIGAQTFEDYEVVIVDDHSTDQTVALAKQYAASDPRVRVIEPSQRAGSSARNANRCLEHARGEWIKFIYQDDVMTPNCLSSLLNATRNGHQFALSWHDYRFEQGVDDETRAFYESLPTLRTVLPGTYVEPGAFCGSVLTHWGTNFLGPTSSSFIHRECFKRYGTFSSKIMTFPDLEYWMRIGSNEGLAIATEYLVTFRVHATSISAGLRNNSLGAYRCAVERVLVSSDLTFAPDYASIRGYLHTHIPAIDPMDLLIMEAKAARWVAVDAKYRNNDLSLLEIWEDFLCGHPQVAAILRKADRRQQTLMEKIRSILLVWLTK
jgi:glycosyltransferase involved in cell wall biosynthesis